ncbi:fasciculation and elongation protein zeta-2-like isoform X3 [Hypomesus transpacificus]|uniref:fasciculation and elongation protein zeta-2-like isoform X3 n=1 Tax=Hypomesus transpacificus TaxID=137520 RepID=UPI001F088712|nr:fasciculation and elongation protein zeta-2-like isoform X3 [Hypomesus transpacificus]
MAAPLAHFDEDWQDFNEFKPVTDSPNRLDLLNSNTGDSSSGLEDLSDLDNSFSGEICSFKSMEDLVHDFDEKLNVCFRNYNSKTENIAPIKPIAEDTFLKDDEVWNALTDNYGNVMPVDWRTSHTRSLHLPTLNLRDQQQQESCPLELSDDEDLREQMDMHSIIVSCISNEPLFTAEQVMEEIEEIMQESPDMEDERQTLPPELSMLAHPGSSCLLRLRQLTVPALTEALEEVERQIRAFSEELIQQLALRDELDFEKEVKNGFISLLIEVQNRQKELREQRRKTRPAPQGARAHRTHVPGTYLTTVIPYERKTCSVEDLQILTKILHAMRDDSDKVPSLLTDYILKVLCPT